MSKTLRLREQAISRTTENRDFTCARCRTRVFALRNGSYRDHCPSCLWSRHVDDRPGDRAESCGGWLEPIAVAPGRRDWTIVYRCLRCAATRRNRAATDDPGQPDDIDALAALPGDWSR